MSGKTSSCTWRHDIQHSHTCGNCSPGRRLRATPVGHWQCGSVTFASCIPSSVPGLALLFSDCGRLHQLHQDMVVHAYETSPPAHMSLHECSAFKCPARSMGFVSLCALQDPLHLSVAVWKLAARGSIASALTRSMLFPSAWASEA